MLKLSESIQVIGINSGVPSLIVQLPIDILNRSLYNNLVGYHSLRHIIFKGYEPLDQRQALIMTIQDIKLKSTIAYTFEIMTSGQLRPLSINAPILYTVFPDVKNFNPTILREFRSIGSQFIFFIADITDLQDVDLLLEVCKLRPSSIYIAPVFPLVDIEDTKILLSEIIKRSYNFSIELDELLDL